MENDTRQSTTAAIGRVEFASSDEVRALITVLWELASKMDRILSMFDRQAEDPRYKTDLYRPR